jgi:hypothetical protein
MLKYFDLAQYHLYTFLNMKSQDSTAALKSQLIDG